MTIALTTRRPQQPAITPTTRTAVLPTKGAEDLLRLNLGQQGILAELMGAARRKAGGHCAIDSFRRCYWARRWRGRTHWSVTDCFGNVLASGESS